MPGQEPEIIERIGHGGLDLAEDLEGIVLRMHGIRHLELCHDVVGVRRRDQALQFEVRRTRMNDAAFLVLAGHKAEPFAVRPAHNPITLNLPSWHYQSTSFLPGCSED